MKQKRYSQRIPEQLGHCFLSAILFLCLGCASSSNSGIVLGDSSAVENLKAQNSILKDVVSQKYLDRLVNKLRNSDDPSHRSLPIRVVILRNSDAIALSSASGEILLSSGLVTSFSNESQLAFIVAHEIAHIELGHQVTALDPADAFTVTRELEMQADQAAMYKILSAGYDPRQALLALAQVYRLKGIDLNARSHPDLSKRAFQLQRIMMQAAWSPSANSAQREFNSFRLKLAS